MPFWLGVPTWAGPLDAVSRNRLLPAEARPALLTKRASCNWPTVVGVVSLSRNTSTVPSGLIDTELALPGMVMPGWIS